MVAYIDVGDIRTFLSTADNSEFVWHRDREDRIIEVLEGNDWRFQYDDSLPYIINKGDKFVIKKMKYHRLIQGINNLVVRITKNVN